MKTSRYRQGQARANALMLLKVQARENPRILAAPWLPEIVQGPAEQVTMYWSGPTSKHPFLQFWLYLPFIPHSQKRHAHPHADEVVQAERNYVKFLFRSRWPFKTSSHEWAISWGVYRAAAKSHGRGLNRFRGDLINLHHSVCDALSGIVWQDDHLITAIAHSQEFRDQPQDGFLLIAEERPTNQGEQDARETYPCGSHQQPDRARGLAAGEPRELAGGGDSEPPA